MTASVSGKTGHALSSLANRRLIKKYFSSSFDLDQLFCVLQLKLASKANVSRIKAGRRLLPPRFVISVSIRTTISFPSWHQSSLSVSAIF
ncbi:hypothetical protein [Rhodoferax sp.]|uniref:hypothetical protein n=1 Tax=Rhodoferax sp. TaxID=50421 RepID=UPI0025F8AB0C|nr:hypothetical protein [Rhodoferax sp.]MCM2297419.1 hypothetical protein [Rhodoferax sp.]